MNRCKTCIHYSPATDGGYSNAHLPPLGFGGCDSDKFVSGYWSEDVAPLDGVRVENDEGWAFYVGEDFGCVHHEVIT